MRVFKFGGASVKDADGVRNVLRVIETHGNPPLTVVVSAMGKTTNALEELVAVLLDGGDWQSLYADIIKRHKRILADLFKDATDRGKQDHPLNHTQEQVDELGQDLYERLQELKGDQYNFVYDQIVSYGELLSTTIVSGYLRAAGMNCRWLDARRIVHTDNKYRDAGVDWKRTQRALELLTYENEAFVTQGFIGSDPQGNTTTLGREGSDYSAAIFAYCLKAESVSIWKDVQGVFNGDPRVFENTALLEQISYREAIELAFYGASVIHPKTLQPLQKAGIPLYVRSFENLNAPGTVISDGSLLKPKIPCFIVRRNLILLRISSRDFSFINEDNISNIFHELHRGKLQVGLIQNSAISFSICAEDKYERAEDVVAALRERYEVELFKNVNLYTIRHHNPEAVASLSAEREILLRQFTQETMQMVCK